MKPIQTASLGFFSWIPFPSKAMWPFHLPYAPRDTAGGCQHRGDAAPAPSASSEAGATGGRWGPPPAQKAQRWVRGTLAESSAQGQALIQAGDRQSACSTFCTALHLTTSAAAASCSGSLEVCWLFWGFFLWFFFFYMPLPRRES